jgi:hypothetical protein
VDAQVFYAEAGLEIRGLWRTADGTSGQLTGTKALAGLALGGALGTEMGVAREMGEPWDNYSYHNWDSYYSWLMLVITGCNS